MRLTPDQERICDEVRDFQKVAVMASHGVGKCLAPTEELTLEDGSRESAADLVDREFSLLTLTDDGALVYCLARAAWAKTEPIFTLRTRAGAQVRRNGRHPLWVGRWNQKEGTIRPVGWVPLRDITDDDYVAGPRWTPCRAQGFEYPALLYLAGALYGDNRAHNSLPAFTPADFPVHTARLKEAAKLLGGHLLLREKGHQAPRLMPKESEDVPSFVRAVNDFLDARDRPLPGQRDFRCPRYLYGLRQGSLAVFLEALFRQASLHPDAPARLRSPSGPFLRGIQELLLRFGIASVIGGDLLTVGSGDTVDRLSRMLRGMTARPPLAPWVTEYAPPGMRWEGVAAVTEGPPERTVAVEVPGTGTFITTLYEHNTYIMGGLSLWRYVCFPDSQVITTAPSADSVEDLLWGVIRALWGERPGLMPAAPELHDRNRPRMSHYAVGRVAATGEGFQGRHSRWLMVIMDEAVGIARQYFLATNGMVTDPDNRWALIFNPTDITSAAYQATLDPKWHVIQISALNHPNILAELRGEPRPFPGAVSLGWVNDLFEEDGTRIGKADFDPAIDVEWPPDSGQYWHPGFDLETRCLGRWPTVSTDAIWSEQMWQMAMTRQNVPEFAPVLIGCDVAAGGENDTSIVLSRGPCALFGESSNGWDSTRTAYRLRELADKYGAEAGQAGQNVQVNIDETGGYGRGVIDQSFGYTFVGVHSSSTALDPEHFPNRRSELWFSTATLAKTSGLDLSRLSPEFLSRLRGDFMGVRWEVNPRDQKRVVEPKRKTIKRLGRSPDNADSVNLAYSGGHICLPMLPIERLTGGWSR